MVTFYKYHPPDRHSHRRHRTRCCMTFVGPEAYLGTDTVIKADRLQKRISRSSDRNGQGTGGTSILSLLRNRYPVPHRTVTF